jgi:hypothetical protein
VRASHAEARSPDGGIVRTGGRLDVDVTLQSDEQARAWLYLGVSEGAATPIFLLNPGREVMLEPGTTEVRCSIPRLPLPGGRYYVWGGVYRNWTDGEELLPWQPVCQFDAHGPGLDRAPRAVVRLSPIHVESDWEIDRGSGDQRAANG